MNIYSITKYLHEPQDNIMRVKIKIATDFSTLKKSILAIAFLKTFFVDTHPFTFFTEN